MCIDTLGCQMDIAETIAKVGGECLLAVKNNQSDLHTNLQRNFTDLDYTGGAAANYNHSETMEEAHGQTERRTCAIMGGANGLQNEFDLNCR